MHLLHVVEIPVSDLPVGTDDMGFVPRDFTAARILVRHSCFLSYCMHHNAHCL